MAPVISFVLLVMLPSLLLAGLALLAGYLDRNPPTLWQRQLRAEQRIDEAARRTRMQMNVAAGQSWRNMVE